MSTLLDNVPWHALLTDHARFAVTAGNARKYPIDVAPFGGAPDNSAQSIIQLAGLLKPGEKTYVMGDEVVAAPGLIVGEAEPALQMVCTESPREFDSPTEEASPVLLTSEDTPDMIRLTGIVYPAFFRPRTHELGRYYGIRIDDELVAMAGERMALPGYREISGVCTLPNHTGKGYAAQLVKRLMKNHREEGLRSFLHTSPDNARAIALYERLGFSVRKQVVIRSIALQA